jgi:hypothetical protein
MKKTDEMKREETLLYGSPCTETCYAQAECNVCHLMKAPVGRSVPLEMASGRCNWECPGYNQEPRVGHLWPGEGKEEVDGEG